MNGLAKMQKRVVGSAIFERVAFRMSVIFTLGSLCGQSEPTMPRVLE